MRSGASLPRKLRGRLATVGGLFRHFTHRHRFFMVPLLVILLLAALFLLFTGGLSLVAPLVYPLI